MTIADLVWDLGGMLLALALLVLLIIGCEKTFL